MEIVYFDESELIGYKQHRNQIQIIVENGEIKIRNIFFLEIYYLILIIIKKKINQMYFY